MSLRKLQLQAAIIDLDGTLVHTLGDFEIALNQVMKALQLPAATPELIGRSVGKGSSHLVRTVLTHQMQVACTLSGQTAASPSDELLAHAQQLYQQHYKAANGLHAEPYPGVH
ncbi:MAG: phosphoglycolate phosphatase, partial [Limnohabitans sp.]